MTDLLRLITCGSVDDGKSSLIGRLLFDTQSVYVDQLQAVKTDSQQFGTQGEEVDLALLLDGLQAEREQGITIDVAYRHFSSDRRRFILADTPGHEQYTRNMVTGASTADAAIVLVDARKGLLAQTERHSLILSLVGIDQVVLAVNKMDLVDWSEEVFDTIARQYAETAQSLGIEKVIAVPLSALTGDNVTSKSQSMPWYDGSPLLTVLDGLSVERQRLDLPLRFPVQWVNRPHQDFRGLSGTIAGGKMSVGQKVIVQPSGLETTIVRILCASTEVQHAQAGDAITVILGSDLDVGRGDMIADYSDPASVTDQFEADVVWLHEEPMLPGRTYLLKSCSRVMSCTFSKPEYRLDPHTLEQVPVSTLELNDIGVCRISTVQPIAVDPYEANRSTGGFIVIDRYSNATIGAGMIRSVTRQARDVVWQESTVDRTARSAIKGHRPAIIWFTGLSGSGKSTIGNLVEQQLNIQGIHSYLLDGDNLRHGLTRDLSFTPGDRVENIRRVGEVAKLMYDAGLVVICTFVSPYASERESVRSLVGDGEFFEIFVDTPLEILEERDTKGLYQRARAGLIGDLTGVNSPYERPTAPSLRVNTTVTSAQQAALEVVQLLHGSEIIRVSK